MEIAIIMRKEHLKEKHHDHALEWHDDEKAYWICNDTDNWKTEECSFGHQTGDLTVSLLNEEGLFVSLKIPLIDISLAASKVNLSSIIDKNIDKLKDAREAFEKMKVRPDQ